MADDYTPPQTNLPFTFSEGGYAKPVFGPLNFNFRVVNPRNLSAAVQVMQFAPYKEEAYTYTKECQTYTIGYGTGGVQILKTRCLYGGIRDLTASVSGYIKTYQVKDLGAFGRGVVPQDLPAYLGADIPRDLAAIMGVRQTQIPRDLHASTYGWTEAYLAAIIGEIESPRDLHAFMKVTSHGEIDLPASTHAWHIRYLKASLAAKPKFDLGGIISPIPAGELWAYIRSFPQEDLPAHTRGWDARDLSATLGFVYTKNLPASISAATDKIKDIWAKVKGFGEGYLDLSAVVQPYYISLLPAYVKAKYFNDISAYVFIIQPKYIRASMHGWAEAFLPASIVSTKWPWDLTASINAAGLYKDLQANISSLQGSNISRNLTAQTKSWLMDRLTANIYGTNAHVLYAYINCLGHSSDLHASIIPKVIRLTTVMDVITMTKKDLTATINYLCFGTGYSNLNSTLYVKYMKELSSYVRGMAIPKTKELPAKVGYSDAYSVVDKLKLSINIYPTDYRVEDKIRLLFTLMASGSTLGAYIRGTLRYHTLTANITGRKLKPYVYDEIIKNRERAVSTTYNGVFKSFEVVEMAFKDMVEDYYYSSDGDYAWKTDRTEKWLLDVKSYIPADLSLGIKRKLHKATTLYDLRRFTSIDEALKYAIDYVTSYPVNNLPASLMASGGFRGLTSTITPRIPIRQKAGMSASLTAIGGSDATDVIISVGGNIIKI